MIDLRSVPYRTTPSPQNLRCAGKGRVRNETIITFPFFAIPRKRYLFVAYVCCTWVFDSTVPESMALAFEGL